MTAYLLMKVSTYNCDLLYSHTARDKILFGVAGKSSSMQSPCIINTLPLPNIYLNGINLL